MPSVVYFPDRSARIICLISFFCFWPRRGKLLRASLCINAALYLCCEYQCYVCVCVCVCVWVCVCVCCGGCVWRGVSLCVCGCWLFVWCGVVVCVCVSVCV